MRTIIAIALVAILAACGGGNEPLTPACTNAAATGAFATSCAAPTQCVPHAGGGCQ